MIRVTDNNQPGWKCIVETAPNVTLPVGTQLVEAEPVKRAYALLWRVLTDGFYLNEARLVNEARRLLLSVLTKEQQREALEAAADRRGESL